MERFGGRLLAVLAPIVFLALDPAGWYPFGPIKWAALILVGATGAVAVVLAHDLRTPRPLVLALAGFVGALVVAAVFGQDGRYGWTGTPERHLGVVTWALCALLLLAGRTFVDRRAVDRLLAGLIVAGLGVGGVATIEALGFHAEVLDLGGRLTGSFGSAAYLGAVAAFLLPVVLGVAATADASVVRRRFAAVAAGLLAVAIAGSGTRAAWVGLAVAGGGTVLARRRPLLVRLSAERNRALVGLGLVVVTGALIIVLSPVGARLGSTTDGDAPGGQGRLDEWRIAASVIVDHPVLGVGPEGYRVAFAAHVDADYEREHGRDQQPDRAHSGPLDVLLAGGVLALLGWLSVLAVVGRAVVRALRTGAPWLVGLAAALLAHVVTQLLFFPIVELEPVVWLVAGVVLVAADRGRAAPAIRSSVGRLRAAAVAAVAVLALVEGVTGIVADHRADDAAEALERGDGRAAASAAASAVDLRPDQLRLHLLAAQAYVTAQRGVVAGLAEVDDALALSPGDPIARRMKAQLLVDRAAATTVPAHLDAAAEYLDALLEDDPNNSRLWALEADVASLQGNEIGAERARARAEDLTPLDQR
jgi:O-antigen ligase